jgi:hypothetical protein
MKLTAWVDAAEKNLEAWDAKRLAARAKAKMDASGTTEVA